jgi:hypothetical protein
MPLPYPTMRTAGFSPFFSFIRGFGLPPFRGRVSSRQPPVPREQHAGLTRAVETVEKVPFQKLTIEKWDKTIEKRLVFLCSAQPLDDF